MTTKDFIRLPLGNYTLIDGIHTYTLYKSECDDGDSIYQIVEKGSSIFSKSVCLFEDKDEEFYNRPFLRGLSGVGGISIHGQISYSTLSNLEILFNPENSITKFLKSINPH